MPFPYKKMDETDFAYIRSVTDPARVWTGDASPRNITTTRCRNTAYFLRNCMWRY